MPTPTSLPTAGHFHQPPACTVPKAWPTPTNPSGLVRVSHSNSSTICLQQSCTLIPLPLQTTTAPRYYSVPRLCKLQLHTDTTSPAPDFVLCELQWATTHFPLYAAFHQYLVTMVPSVPTRTELLPAACLAAPCPKHNTRLQQLPNTMPVRFQQNAYSSA